MALVYGSLAVNYIGLVAAAVWLRNGCADRRCRTHHPADPLPTVPLVRRHRRTGGGR